MSDVTKTGPTLEAKAEAVLAQLLELADTTPGGVEFKSGGTEYSIGESYGLAHEGVPTGCTLWRKDLLLDCLND